MIAEQIPDAAQRVGRIQARIVGDLAHGANESLHLADFERACLAELLFLTRLAGF